MRRPSSGEIEITASNFETLWDEHVVGPQLRDDPLIDRFRIPACSIKLIDL
jgi:hypothetical protein